jgi:hypothetical protein
MLDEQRKFVDFVARNFEAMTLEQLFEIRQLLDAAINKEKTKADRRIFLESEIPEALTNHLRLDIAEGRSFGFGVEDTDYNVEGIEDWEVEEIKHNNRLSKWLIANGAKMGNTITIKIGE